MRPRSSGLLLSLGALAALGCSGSNRGTTQPAGETPSPTVTPSAPSRRGALLYGPVNQGRYQLDTRDSIAMEMPDGLVQRTVTVKTAFLTISLRPREEAFAVVIALDSMFLDRPNPMLQPLVDSARGTRWQAVLRRTGRMDSVAANHQSVFGEQVRALLQRLLPIVPDSGAEPGDRWQDRTTMPYQIMAGFAATESRTADYQAGKWEDENGRRVLVVRSRMTYSVTGSGSGFGQEIRFEGNGAAEGVHRMTANGVLSTAEVTDSLRMILNVPAVGQSVPTTVVTSYSLRSLP